MRRKDGRRTGWRPRLGAALMGMALGVAAGAALGQAQDGLEREPRPTPAQPTESAPAAPPPEARPAEEVDYELALPA